MAEIARDWGYIHKGLVYPHFDSPPPENTLKYFTSYRLYSEIDIEDGVIEYQLIQVYYGHHTGGPMSAYFADPIYPLVRIR